MVQQMWEVYAQTSSGPAAAAAIGVDRKTAFSWIAEQGGVRPRQGRHPSGRRLCFEDRCAIEAGLAVQESQVSIAGRIGFDKATVSREVGRGKLVSGRYSAKRGQAVAVANAKRPKTSKLATIEPLRARVEEDLGKRYSPQQISARLRRDFPDEPEMWVHHNTIYESLYLQARGALRADLAKCLRSGRIRRRPQRPDGYEERRGQIPDKLLISMRPVEVADRAVPGHWEGDLIKGKLNASAIGTMVERTTNYTLLLHLPEGFGTEQVTAALIARLSQLPAQLRRSVTWDQGKEMAAHAKLTGGVLGEDFKVYFCDPRSPWQRAVNENTNGLLRQYFPKGTHLSNHTAADLAWVEQELNDRPRKRLDYLRPSEVIGDLLLH
ncbi:MAG: IS30 family transposase [Marmoricola sp.]